MKIIDTQPSEANLLSEVVEGLSRQPKTIPPKFFYNERGSQLFNAICETTEYYQTRTENHLLQQHAPDIAQRVNTGAVLIEPGSGNSQKVKHLLPTLQPHSYVAIDISKQHLFESTEALSEEFPNLPVVACCADFTKAFPLPELDASPGRLVFFPGSSIGNFEPEDAIGFLQHLKAIAGFQGQLLIGVDLKKSSDQLTAAYNDNTGYTRDFNLNLLQRINEELSADFDLEQFHHDAFYNQDEGRVEMHLRSRCEQEVRIQGHRFQFQANESVHTENSYKYHVEEFSDLAHRAGFKFIQAWKDAKELFSIQLYQTCD